MIPIEQFAACTTQMAEIATELKVLDQAWTALNEEFARLTTQARQQHGAGLAAGQTLSRLAQIDALLTGVERAATEAMTLSLPLLRSSDND